MPTVNLLIKGKVQGVYYRIAAKEKADELGITGWVKYDDDGRVEIMATGNDKQIKQFTDWCKRGPEKAEVTNVISTPLTEQQFESFTIAQDEYPHDV